MININEDYDYLLIKKENIKEYRINLDVHNIAEHEIISNDSMYFKSEELLQYLEEIHRPKEISFKAGDDFVDSFKYWITDDTVSDIFKQANIKGKEGNYMKVLEIYEKYQKTKLDAEQNDKIKEVINNSEIKKIVDKLQKQADKELEKIIPNYKEENIKYISFDFLSTKEMQIEKEKIYKEIDIKRYELDEKIKEVKALLEETENYEQKMDILKAYEIIDSNGKIIK